MSGEVAPPRRAAVMVAAVCAIGAVVSVAWPQGAVRVAAVLVGVLVAGLVLHGVVGRMAGVGPLLPTPVVSRPIDIVEPTELAALRRELVGGRPTDAIPDLVYSRAQSLARRRITASRGLDPFTPADHPRLAAELSPTMFRLVMNGLAGAAPGSSAALRPAYVPIDLRPTLAELPALIEEIASL